MASASVTNDAGDSDYLQASISGKERDFFIISFLDERYSTLLLRFLAAMDERLSSYALIARAAIDVTIPLLTRLFSEHFARLHQVLYSHSPPPPKKKK